MRTSTPPSTPNALGLSVSINDDLIGSLSHSLEAPPDEFCAWRTALTPHYAVGERLGVGSYGVVASAVTLTVAAGLPVNSRVAIKRIMGASADNLLGAKRTLRELCLLRRLRHDNCISILDLLRSRDEDAAVYLVTQIMDTDLAQVIDSDQPLTGAHVTFITYSVLKAVHYLHSCGVVHRDLKPANIFINQDCHVRVGDLGMARLLRDSGADNDVEPRQANLTEYVVTRWWRAPEVMIAQSYGFEIDVWSVGTIYAELAIRKPLFRGRDYADQLRKILGVLGTPPEDEIAAIPDAGARDFVRSLPHYERVPWRALWVDATVDEEALLDGLLAFNPVHRLSVQKCLESRVFAAVRDEQSEMVAAEVLRLPFVDDRLVTLDDVNSFLAVELTAADRERHARLTE